MKRFLNLIGIVVVGVLSLAAMTFGAVAIVNRHDAAPSADYLHLKRLVADRPPLADAGNGFIYLLGIRAAPGADPRYLGARRLTWLEGLDRDMSRLNEDPGEGDTLPSAVAKLLGDNCGTVDWRKCRTAFDMFPAMNRWSASDRLLLERYGELIRHSGWREHVGNDVRQPIPTFGDALNGQRTFLLSLRGADAATLHELLAREHAFWRMVLASSDTLISKLIATSALRQHFQFGNLLLRRLPAADSATAMPAAWRMPLTRDELSVERVLAGELEQMEQVWRKPTVGEDNHPVRLPFSQPQDISNEMAAEYRELSAAFNVPLSDFARVEGEWRSRAPRHPFPSRLYDITGDYLRQLAKGRFEDYPRRFASVEAWRRAALTAVELRARGVPAARVAAELEVASARNPFDGRPFGWSGDEQAVIYEGIEKQPPERRRQVYSY